MPDNPKEKEFKVSFEIPFGYIYYDHNNKIINDIEREFLTLTNHVIFNFAPTIALSADELGLANKPMPVEYTDIEGNTIELMSDDSKLLNASIKTLDIYFTKEHMDILARHKYDPDKYFDVNTIGSFMSHGSINPNSFDKDGNPISVDNVDYKQHFDLVIDMIDYQYEYYPLTFETNGGSPVDTQTILRNTLGNVPDAPTRPGYIFIDWYEEASLSNVWDSSMPIKAPKTVYAKWMDESQMKNVKFDTQGGEEIEEQWVEYNTPATKPLAPHYDGYIFAGWFTELEYLNEWNFSTPVTEDMTLNAKWLWEGDYYRFSFNSYGGTPVPEQIIEYEQFATEPTPPTKTGFIFDGWYAEFTLDNKWDFSTPITESRYVHAKWIEDPNYVETFYTVNFETNGGSPVGSETVLENTAVTKPADPTRDGYTFEGWCEDALLQTPFDFATLINQDTTVYAKWEKIPVNYTVTFETNGGSAIGNETVLENTAVTKPADPTRDGYTFAGWHEDALLQTPFDFATLINADTTVYAKWDKIPVNYTVTFETNGGSPIGNETVLENTAVTKPADPTRDGYTFEGWYTDSTLQTPFDFATLINADTTVYAKWEKIPVTYTVTFETNGGSPIGNETVLENTAVTKPADPTRDGYTFEGWYTDSTLQTSFDFATLINADTTVYAKWEKIPVNYTVTFETNGGSAIGDETVPENTAVTKPVDPTRDGYTFVGWYADSTLQTPFDFATLINADTTVYAKWEKIPVNYTVTFETNGGSPIGNETVPENTAVSKPVDPTFVDHTFEGWFTDSTLQTPFDFATLINADTTVYAKWEKIPVNYTVTFETNGGSAIGDETVPENTAVTKPVDPTRDGYTFVGWYADSTLQTPFDFATLINADTTVYAKWEKIPVNYTVTFETNGGSPIGNETVPENTAVSKPVDPTFVDHTFEGWFTDSTLQTPFDFATLINADTTLYAKWSTAMTPIDTYYTVSYESNGGSAVVSERVLANTKATQPNAPTLVDHTFEGWFTDATLQTPFDFATLINVDTTLYAKWSTNMTPIDPVKPKPIDPVKPTPVDPEPIVPTPVTPKPDVQEPGVETPKETLPATGIDSNKNILIAVSLAILGVAIYGLERKRKRHS